MADFIIPPPASRAAWSWPLESKPRWRDSSLGAFRRGSKRKPDRHHQGVDVGAASGDVVLAMHGGRILNWFGWEKGISALVVGDELGSTIYGALDPKSLTTLGLALGDTVDAGQELGWIAPYPGGGSMLHIEAYQAGTKHRPTWVWGTAPPASLRDVRVQLKASRSSDELHQLEPREPPAVDADDREYFGLGKLLEELDKPPGSPVQPPPSNPNTAGIVPLVAIGAALGLLALAL